jgi:hypothetical protein
MILTRYQSLEIGEQAERPEPSTHQNYGFKINLPQAIFLLILFLFLLCFATYVSLELAGSGTADCLGPPYLYISYHESHNIMKYTRDGCPLSPNVLWFGGAIGSTVGSIRGMVNHPYGGENEDETGRVLVFDSCAEVNGMRPYLKTLVDVRTSPGAQHTYSLAFDSRNNMYVSYQHTDVVLRYSNATFRPLPSVSPVWYNDLYSKDDTFSINPPINAPRNYTPATDFYKGTFVQVLFEIYMKYVDVEISMVYMFYLFFY